MASVFICANPTFSNGAGQAQFPFSGGKTCGMRGQDWVRLKTTLSWETGRWREHVHIPRNLSPIFLHWAEEMDTKWYRNFWNPWSYPECPATPKTQNHPHWYLTRGRIVQKWYQIVSETRRDFNDVVRPGPPGPSAAQTSLITSFYHNVDSILRYGNFWNLFYHVTVGFSCTLVVFRKLL